jgi:antitoxin component YwqK of YwqJK toxin-antitoxin module
MKKLIISVLLLLAFSLTTQAITYKPSILGRDTSACLKEFPSNYTSSTKTFLYKNYFSYKFVSGKYAITQFFTPDSQVVCQKSFIDSSLISVIAISRNNKLVPDVFLNCGIGKIRDYNWVFQNDSWGGISTDVVVNITDIYYDGGKLIMKVDIEMYGKDTLSFTRYRNGKLNGWCNYYSHGKVSYRRLYENDVPIKIGFPEKGYCKKNDLVFDTIKEMYSLQGKICSGKISVFTVEGFFNGMLDRELFFTNGKIDSVIVYHSSQWAIISRVVVDYRKIKWTVYQYYPNGDLNWITNCIYEPVPEEKSKAFDFPDRGSSVKTNGPSWDYYPGGKIKAEYNFKNGLRDGKSVFYDESGNITKVINYKDDQILPE